MNKRYQIFVSSTFMDLKEERQRVMNILMDMGHIPVGMEYFLAMDMKQFEYIKRMIDDSDYYILIIGGRYGSIGEAGISYTEMEYDYAVGQGKPVIAFLHTDLDAIPVGKSERNEKYQELLKAFRQKVSNTRLIKGWKTIDELCLNVPISLIKTMNEFPAVGWVRANLQTSIESLQEINYLRKELEATKEELIKLRNKQQLNTNNINIADINEHILVSGTITHYWKQQKTITEWKSEVTWKNLFESIAPFLLEVPNDTKVQSMLASIAYSYTKNKLSEWDVINIDPQNFQTIKIQFIALNLITVNYTQTTKGGMALFWNLTETGKKLMIQLRTIKTNQPNPFRPNNKP